MALTPRRSSMSLLLAALLEIISLINAQGYLTCTPCPRIPPNSDSTFVTASFGVWTARASESFDLTLFIRCTYFTLRLEFPCGAAATWCSGTPAKLYVIMVIGACTPSLSVNNDTENVKLCKMCILCDMYTIRWLLLAEPSKSHLDLGML